MSPMLAKEGLSRFVAAGFCCCDAKQSSPLVGFVKKNIPTKRAATATQIGFWYLSTAGQLRFLLPSWFAGVCIVYDLSEDANFLFWAFADSNVPTVIGASNFSLVPELIICIELSSDCSLRVTPIGVCQFCLLYLVTEMFRDWLGQCCRSNLLITLLLMPNKLPVATKANAIPDYSNHGISEESMWANLSRV